MSVLVESQIFSYTITTFFRLGSILGRLKHRVQTFRRIHALSVGR